MFSKIFLVSVVVAVALIGFVAPECRAETEIHLKDGRVIKVDSFWREEGMVKYQSRAGIVGFSLSDVAQIITPDMVAFDETRNADTIDAYQRFVKNFPKSEFTGQAKERIIELQFEEVRRIGTAQVFLDYAQRNPSSPFVQQARNRAEEITYEDAASQPAAEKYTEYLRLFPEGRHAADVAAALEKMEYEGVIKSADVGAMEAFLGKYPDTPYREQLTQAMAELNAAAQARAQKKAELEKKRREQAAIEKTKSRKLWISVGAGLLGLALIGAAVIFFLRRRTQEEPEIIDEEVEDFLGEAAAEGRSLSDYGPGRYEDIVGVEREPETLELPDGPASERNPDEPMALPNPEWADKKPPEPPEDDGSVFLKAEDALRGEPSPAPAAPKPGVRQAGGAPEAHPPSADEVIDLSDGDTDFKLELEDIPEAPSPEQAAGPAAEPDSVDLSDGDLPDLFADEETIRRRGGGG